MRAAALAALVLTPTPALACATCISSPFGDQTSTWPYLGLILLPFGLIVAIAGILGYLSLKERLGWRGPSPATACGAHDAGHRPSSMLRRLLARYAPKDDSQIIKETI
ncbi:MAG TPA: hypothetical protein VFE97_25380 [Methylomirabilota bacterium]|jgi:hypothetical protein|nr:hypothetical protein [Methylomirabilota bacterium]